MIAKYNRTSLCWGIPGVVLQNVGLIAVLGYTSGAGQMESIPPYVPLMCFMSGVGTILLLIGLAYYAAAKGQNVLWCLSSVLGILGLLILALLKDKCPTTGDPASSAIDVEANAKRKTSKLAISSLVLSILGVFSLGITAVLGLVLGILAIIRIKHSQDRLTGQGMAILGIVISSVIICICGYVIFMAATA